MNANAKEITKIPPPSEQDLERLTTFWDKMPKGSSIERDFMTTRIGVVPHSMRPAKSMRPNSLGLRPKRKLLDR